MWIAPLRSMFLLLAQARHPHGTSAIQDAIAAPALCSRKTRPLSHRRSFRNDPGLRRLPWANLATKWDPPHLEDLLVGWQWEMQFVLGGRLSLHSPEQPWPTVRWALLGLNAFAGRSLSSRGLTPATPTSMEGTPRPFRRTAHRAVYHLFGLHPKRIC